MATKAQQLIKRADLARNFTACYRVEDAIWRELRGFGVTEYSRAADVQRAVEGVHLLCPSWCEIEAWDRIGEMFVNWSATFGTLQTFWQLRRKQDKHGDE